MAPGMKRQDLTREQKSAANRKTNDLKRRRRHERRATAGFVTDTSTTATVESVAATPITTVTEEDLRAFHAKHYGQSQAPAQLFTSSENDGWCYEEEDDGLGYYPDGVKRTLTDEQIKIFRHSEIQTILRERVVKQENAEADGETEFAIDMSPIEQDIAKADGENDIATDTTSVKREDAKAHNYNATGSDTRPAVEATPTIPNSLIARPEAALHRTEDDKAAKDATTQAIVSRPDQSAQANRKPTPMLNSTVAIDQLDGRASPKRKWDDYIEDSETNPDEMTHRRLAREMDELKPDYIELEY